MPQRLNRRDFVMGGTTAGMLASTGLFGAGPQIIRQGVKPIVVSANNGNRSKDSKTGLTCVATAFKALTTYRDVRKSGHRRAMRAKSC